MTELSLRKIAGKRTQLDVQTLLARQENHERKDTTRIHEGLAGK